MTSAASPEPTRHLRWWLLGGLVLALAALALVPEVRSFLARGWAAIASRDPQVTRAFVEGVGWAGPLALLAAFVIQAVLPFLPAVALIAVTVRAYGPLEGFAIVYVGALLGAAAGYGLGRSLGEPLVRALAGRHAADKARQLAEQHGLRGVLLIRLMPILPSEAVSLVAGALSMGFRPFMLATALGVLPVTVLVVWLSGDLHRLLLGLVGFSAVVALSAGVRLWLARRAARTSAQPPVR